MRRRGFLRALFLAPFIKPAILSAMQPRTITFRMRSIPIKAKPMKLGRGHQFMETGYVYAPYIPLYRTDKIL